MGGHNPENTAAVTDWVAQFCKRFMGDYRLRCSSKSDISIDRWQGMLLYRANLQPNFIFYNRHVSLCCMLPSLTDDLT